MAHIIGQGSVLKQIQDLKDQEVSPGKKFQEFDGKTPQTRLATQEEALNGGQFKTGEKVNDVNLAPSPATTTQTINTIAAKATSDPSLAREGTVVEVARALVNKNDKVVFDDANIVSTETLQNGGKW